jgi:hypothetical protein
MIKALSLAAALALLPVSAAYSQERGALDQGAPQEQSAEAALEAAAEAFEVRMEEFGTRAEAIAGDESLSEAQQEAAVMALWAQYEPAVAEFTAFATQQAGLIAAEAMADIDMDALVAEAMSDINIEGLVADTVEGINVAALADATRNGAWASGDPEHMATYGLMADYALGSAMDEMEEVEDGIATDQAERATDLAREAIEAAREAAEERGDDD